jgi:hypothetical protein
MNEFDARYELSTDRLGTKLQAVCLEFDSVGGQRECLVLPKQLNDILHVTRGTKSDVQRSSFRESKYFNLLTLLCSSNLKYFDFLCNLTACEEEEAVTLNAFLIQFLLSAFLYSMEPGSDQEPRSVDPSMSG